HRGAGRELTLGVFEAVPFIVRNRTFFFAGSRARKRAAFLQIVCRPNTTQFIPKFSSTTTPPSRYDRSRVRPHLLDTKRIILKRHWTPLPLPRSAAAAPGHNVARRRSCGPAPHPSGQSVRAEKLAHRERSGKRRQSLAVLEAIRNGGRYRLRDKEVLPPERRLWVLSMETDPDAVNGLEAPCL